MREITSFSIRDNLSHPNQITDPYSGILVAGRGLVAAPAVCRVRPAPHRLQACRYRAGLWGRGFEPVGQVQRVSASGALGGYQHSIQDLPGPVVSMTCGYFEGAGSSDWPTDSWAGRIACADGFRRSPTEVKIRGRRARACFSTLSGRGFGVTGLRAGSRSHYKPGIPNKN